MAAERLTDAQRTALMMGLLAPGALGLNPATNPAKSLGARRLLLTEVADGVGGTASGYADAVELSVWPSDGFQLDGYEVKASRSDLKRELGKPTKWKRVGQFCHRWWLVVWDERWLDDPRIPEDWGTLAHRTTDGGESTLRVVRKAKGVLAPTPLTRHFMSSLIRRAAETSPGAALLEQMRQVGVSAGRTQGKSEARDRELAALREAYDVFAARWRERNPLAPAWRAPPTVGRTEELVQDYLALAEENTQLREALRWSSDE